MCGCGLLEGIHWWVDTKVAGCKYMVAATPEQAEYYLRRWAAKVLREGHEHPAVRPLAGKILSTRILDMVALCVHKDPNTKVLETD